MTVLDAISSTPFFGVLGTHHSVIKMHNLTFKNHRERIKIHRMLHTALTNTAAKYIGMGNQNGNQALSNHSKIC